MLRTRYLVFCGVACGLLLAAGTARAKDLKVGVVDLQRAVSETKEGQQAEKQLMGMKDKLEAELNRKLKEFYKKQEDISKRMTILKDSEKRRLQQEMQQQFQGLQKRYLEAERELMSKKTKMMLKITKKLGRIIKKIAAKEGFDYIFNNAALLHAPRHVDLTNEVIRRYNQGK